MIIFVTSLIFLSFLFAQTPAYRDKVVAVVGNETILESEIREIIEFFMPQIQQTQKNIDTLELKNQILEELIKEKLLVLEAKADTTIRVTPDEVDRFLNEYISDLESQMGKERFEEELKSEGLTRETFKQKMRKKATDQIYIQKLVEKRIKPKIVVTPKELREFYERKKDSIPEIPEQVQLAAIQIRIKPGHSEMEKAKNLAQQIREKILKGESFEELAKRYSDDPFTKDLGGDMGYMDINEIDPPFDTIIRKLKVGRISDVISDNYSFQIIRLDERKNNTVRVSRILILPKTTSQDTIRAKNRIDALYTRLKEKRESFEELARRYSDDEFSKDRGGILGWFVVDQLPPEVANVVTKIEKGEITKPILTHAGYYVFKVLDKRQKGRPKFEEIQDELNLLLQQLKLNQEIEKLVSELKKKFFVEIKN